MTPHRPRLQISLDTWAVLLSLLLAALVKFNVIRVVGW
jgi:hypothetical protein